MDYVCSMSKRKLRLRHIFRDMTFLIVTVSCMLFSSSEFIFYFLPVVFVLYLLLVRWGGRMAAGGFLAVASLFFYAWWKPIYLPLILVSIGFNFGLSRCFLCNFALPEKTRRLWLIAGITANLLLLGYYKYSWFVVEVGAELMGNSFRITPLLLPLAISFFTFQQIAFLVDAWKGEVRDFRFFDYVLFVSFFPQLIAGPIVHHREMMPQFANEQMTRWPGWVNIEQGIRIFMIGLAKKLIMADSLAVFANAGWGHSGSLQFWGAWATTLCYTFQLYFDFSGYSDMALGAARFFGIHLPINFNSPYKARNIQDFWARWHMTLSRWLKEYLYIPLGGNRKGSMRTYRNLFLTFLLGGIWHGAGWTFILWGAWHGAGCVVHRFVSKLFKPFPMFFAWLMTFGFVHIGWVFFRAPGIKEASGMLQAMMGLRGIEVIPPLANLKTYFLHLEWLKFKGTAFSTTEPQVPLYALLWITLCFILTLGFRNGIETTLQRPIRHPVAGAVFFALLALICILFSIRAEESPFLYFNF